MVYMNHKIKMSFGVTQNYIRFHEWKYIVMHKGTLGFDFICS